jgi:hypothetical protein
MFALRATQNPPPVVTKNSPTHKSKKMRMKKEKIIDIKPLDISTMA